MSDYGYLDHEDGELEMTPEQARDLAKKLLKKAKRAEKYR